MLAGDSGGATGARPASGTLRPLVVELRQTERLKQLVKRSRLLPDLSNAWITNWPGVSTEESAENKRLKAENRRLTEDLEIMRRASFFFAGELDPATGDLRIHRPTPVGRSCSRVDLSRSAQSRPADRRTDLPGVDLTPANGSCQGRQRRRRRGRHPWAGVWQPDSHGRRTMQPAGLYGRRKMLAEVRRAGLPSGSPGAVGRAMHTPVLSGVLRTKKVYTTVADPDVVRAPDLVDWDFTSDRPDRQWIAEFTYVGTWAGFTYVAFIVDVFAQRIVAWNAATTMFTDLVWTPLRIALWQRDHEGHPIEPKSLISDSDAGIQYTSVAFTDYLALKGTESSLGSVGDAYDNALMETIKGLYRADCIRSSVFHDEPCQTLSDVEYATAAWVKWYTNDRLHSSLGYAPPIEFEQSYYAALNRELQPT